MLLLLRNYKDSIPILNIAFISENPDAISHPLKIILFLFFIFLFSSSPRENNAERAKADMHCHPDRQHVILYFVNEWNLKSNKLVWTCKLYEDLKHYVRSECSRLPPLQSVLVYLSLKQSSIIILLASPLYVPVFFFLRMPPPSK